MLPSFKSILIAMPVIVALDLAWVGWLMKPFYEMHLRSLLNFVGGSLQPRIIPMIITYVIMVLIVVCVAVPLANTYGGSSNWLVFAIGAVVGILVYGLYNLTNLTLIKDWSLAVTIADTIWGGIIIGASTFAVWFFS